MTVPARVVPDLDPAFAGEWRRWAESTLERLSAPDAVFLTPSSELLELLLRQRREIAAWLVEVSAASGDGGWERHPARFVRRELVRWLWQKNQFLYLDGAAEAALETEIRAVLGRAAALLASDGTDAEITAGVRELLAGGRARVATLVAEQLGTKPRDVVASEYSPDLELRILKLSPEALLEPILDVGCGKTATLVRLLRAQGRVASGIDREAPPDVATPADWLAFDYGSERWGTVLSHLGFSLHFLHHHLKGTPAAFVYAHGYMRILRSLKVGGTFAYAPALPFIEALLPASTYARDSGALPDALRTEAVVRVERTTELELGTSTRIRRIAADAP